MHTQSRNKWSHDHSFGQENRKSGERRTMIVIFITATMMIIEIAAGLRWGSMALLADGLHMGSHASALTISVFAYIYSRRHARDDRFSFGTGKINSLAGFASAVLLVIFAAAMAWESVDRFIHPVKIVFNQAIMVAVLGLIVNGTCLLILRDDGHGHSHSEEEHHEDHNLWSAYLHVLADALTSVLAISALLAGKYFGLMWMDPLMGIVGAILVTHWSWSLIRTTSHVLLDMQAPNSIRTLIRDAIEKEGDGQVTDLHVWSIGAGNLAAEIAVVSADPQSPDYYRKLIPQDIHLVHVAVEANRRGISSAWIS